MSGQDRAGELLAAGFESTHMFREAASASAAVRAQFAHDAHALQTMGEQIRKLAPRTVITCARGSSDHAATYAKYLIETRARIPTASAALSISSVYGVRQDLRQCLYIAISQSGRSPDLLASVALAKDSGATVLAICNSPDAPLNAGADHVIELRAGPEQSVAATKSYLATLAALARFVAAWTRDASLDEDLARLPDLMDEAWRMDWTSAVAMLANVEHLYVVGRGIGLAAAQEVALKCKETCRLHAEGFSSAELRHGPYTLLGPNFPALLLTQDDATRPGVVALATELAKSGVRVLLAGAEAKGAVQLPSLPCPATLAPILLVQSAYRYIGQLAFRRGFNPDFPAHLRKVTETV
jgi:glucosamine--fructose-6-phosphate aminotransferase (isomerizing)